MKVNRHDFARAERVKSYSVHPRQRHPRRVPSGARNISSQVRPAHVHNEQQRVFQVSDVLPLNHFSNSIYSVPMLLFFRLFYHASPWKHDSVSSRGTRYRQIASVTASQPPAYTNTLFNKPRKLHPAELLSYMLHSNEPRERLKVASVTWVKALASPLSHEYIQAIITDESSGQRHRIALDRSDAGDVVISGWDWSSGMYPSHHFTLPLPLLTLSFEQPIRAPTLEQFMVMVAQLSSLRQYNLLREMCWWFAEKIFMTTAQEFCTSKIHEWPHAHLRYSFVVRTEWIRRQGLERHAEAFKLMNMHDLRY